MDSIETQGKQATEGATIAGDRRRDRRYRLQLALKWKLVRRRRVLDAGTGHTIDLSSGGILFEAGRRLPEGLNVELSIAWPVLLHNVAHLQLIVTGKIVRGGGHLAAIQTTHHEFRTAGLQNGHLQALEDDTTDNAAFLTAAEMFSTFGRQ